MQAKQKLIRTSPRKIRLVADNIRGLKVDDALNYLSAIGKRAAFPLKKTLNQAIANAVNTKNQAKDSLLIKEIQVGAGPIYKRWQPVSRGRAHSILKRTSHITIKLEAIKRQKEK